MIHLPNEFLATHCKYSPNMYKLKLVKDLFFVIFLAISSNAQGLFLAWCSGMTPSEAQGMVLPLLSLRSIKDDFKISTCQPNIQKCFNSFQINTNKILDTFSLYSNYLPS